MKISMKVTSRDKKLLVFLIVLLIAVVFYFFLFNPLYIAMSEEKSKNEELSNRYSQLKSYEQDFKLNKSKYEEQKLEYINISKEIPPNLTEKYVISDMYKISNQVSAMAHGYKFSKRENLGNLLTSKDNEKSNSNDKNKGVYKYSASTNWEVGYSDLKKLINISKTYESVFSLSNISISPTYDDKLEVAFNVDFIGYDDEKAPLKVWKGLNLITGKEDIFTKVLRENREHFIDGDGESNGESRPLPEVSTISSNNSINTIDKNKDFVVVLSTTNSPTSSVVMEKIGEGKSIFGRNKSVESVSIDLIGRNNEYKYKMSTVGENYPLTGEDELKLKGKDIVIVVYSTSRKGKDDKNIVNINVNNETDRKAYVYVVGDDEKLPRCSVTKGGNNVYVEKR